MSPVMLMRCGDCGTAYAPADRCPHCGGDVYAFTWEEDDMPKITVEGGASDNSAGVPEPPAEEPKPKKRGRPSNAELAAAAAAEAAGSEASGEGDTTE